MMPIAMPTIKGVVSVDDIVHVVQEEATEDFQKIGGVETMEGPYLQVPLLRMIRKRAGWLAALFLGEMLTATAMGQFEAEIARAVVLALFVPLIISSGGNSGSQATTLVIRAMALGELRIRDWWRVIRRELVTGLGLGLILASIGLVRILLAAFVQRVRDHYSRRHDRGLEPHGGRVVGSLMGSILPFILRGLIRSASASAPFVATLVDDRLVIFYRRGDGAARHASLASVAGRDEFFDSYDLSRGSRDR
jgi:magnesium transporter